MKRQTREWKLAVFREVCRCFLERMAGKLCQAIVSILLRAELQSKNILVFWFYNVILPDWEMHSWQHAEEVERGTVISLILQMTGNLQKAKVKMSQCLFFFFLQRNLAEALLLLVQLLIYNWHEVPVELFPNHPCAKRASVFCFHQTPVLASATPKEGNAPASSLCIEDNKAISEDSKPDISSYYNPNKSSVDNLDHLTRL